MSHPTGGPTGLSFDPVDEIVEVPGGRVERVYRPESVASVVEVVKAALSDGAGLLLMGGRTRLACARPTSALDCGLSLEAFDSVLEFEPDEGVIHVAAGARLETIRQLVSEEGWELPLDTPGRASTVGGTIASACLGPRAHAFGSVSDAILGLHVVTGDGVASKCGGRVVKNVTGYDLAKLYCGSFGSLAVLTSAWLRLRPKPERLAVIRARVEPGASQLESVRRLADCSSARAAIWREAGTTDSAEITIELGGSREGVEHDRKVCSALCDFDEIDPSEIDVLRDARVVTSRKGVCTRARVLGSRVDGYRSAARDAGLEEFEIDLGIGVVSGTMKTATATGLAALRQVASEAGGRLTLESLPEALIHSVDPFGRGEGAADLAATLKAKFDPANILNPGRFIVAAKDSPDQTQAVQRSAAP